MNVDVQRPPPRPGDLGAGGRPPCARGPRPRHRLPLLRRAGISQRASPRSQGSRRRRSRRSSAAGRSWPTTSCADRRRPRRPARVHGPGVRRGDRGVIGQLPGRRPGRRRPGRGGRGCWPTPRRSPSGPWRPGPPGGAWTAAREVGPRPRARRRAEVDRWRPVHRALRAVSTTATAAASAGRPWSRSALVQHCCARPSERVGQRLTVPWPTSTTSPDGRPSTSASTAPRAGTSPRPRTGRHAHDPSLAANILYRMGRVHLHLGRTGTRYGSSSSARSAPRTPAAS